MSEESGASCTFRSIFGGTHQKLREFREEDEDEMWLDVPPQYPVGDSKLLEDNNDVNQERIRKNCNKYEDTRVWNRASIEEWVEDDDDDIWKEALDDLQVKVNQLELNTRNDEKIALSNPMIRTLSLSVEQTNDIESKTCGEVEGIENRITEFSIRSQKKQPSAIPPTTVDAIGSPQLNTTTVVNLKKTEKSKNYISRNIRAIEKNRPIKLASSMVAPAKTKETSKISTSILARDRRRSDATNGNILKSPMLAISEPESIRRYVLNEVRKISIERLVANAKRLYYLEAYHEAHKIAGSGNVLVNQSVVQNDIM